MQKQIANGSDVFRMTLHSCGNPDFGQYAPVSPLQGIEAKSLKELCEKAREYIEYFDLGGGNWLDPFVIRNGKRIGFMSYNGRVWKGRKFQADNEEIIF